MANDPLDLAFEVQQLNAANSTIVFATDKGFTTQVASRLKPYKNVPEMFRPALQETADYITETMIPAIFQKEGPGWRPLAARTVAERIAQGYPGRHPILYRSGDLFESLTDKGHPQHVEIIKVGKNSRIEIGSTSKKFVENQQGDPGQHLPQRPMLPGTGHLTIADRDRLAIKSIFQRVMKRHHD